MAASSSRAARNWPSSSKKRATPGLKAKLGPPFRRTSEGELSTVLAVSPQRKTESYLESFAPFEDSAAAHDQEWLRSIRRSAIARFSELGFPTTRDEDWRFTNVAPIAETSFRLARDGCGRFVLGDLDLFVFAGFA